MGGENFGTRPERP